MGIWVFISFSEILVMRDMDWLKSTETNTGMLTIFQILTG